MKIHLDLDCFFASCERVANPNLCGKPIAVGGRNDAKIFEKGFSGKKLYDKNSGAFVPNLFYSENSKQKSDFKNFFVEKYKNRVKIRGIIVTASYEARSYGLKTGMSIAQALGLCPKLLVLPPNHLLYHEFSHKLYKFLKLKIPLVEQYSVDEFFGDLSGWVKDEDLFDFCIKLKHTIYKEFGLPITIGIANSKWAAKLVTSSAKPYGVREIKPKDWDDFIKDMPIKKFPGLASGYERRLKSRGIEKLGEIRYAKELFYSWKLPGITLYRRILGIDSEPIIPYHSRKSIGISRTFDPIKDREEVKRRLLILIRNLSYTILKLELNPTSYFIKVKYEDFLRVKYRITIDRLFNERFFKSILSNIFDNIDIYKVHKIIYIGIRVFNFMEYKQKTYNLLTYEQDVKFRNLGNSLQLLRNKYGIDIVKNASEI
ncbi:MAG: DNA polymerase IV [Epsilonproteobacteria bacterium]|nr:DNA polymerase IV [Campylobacterota bacterium]